MRKILICLLALALLAGCGKEKNADEEKYELYKTIYQQILDTNEKKGHSQSFEIELVCNKLEENSYRYDVIIDQAKVAMYNIKAMAVIDDITSHISDEVMMPTLGILDDGIYNMIPYQVDKDNDFYGGLILSLTTNSPSITLGVYIEYKDINKTKVTREYLKLSTTYQPQAEELEAF